MLLFLHQKLSFLRALGRNPEGAFIQPMTKEKIIIILLVAIALFVSCSKKDRESSSNMVLIPEGKFIIGSNERDSDEAPQREIELKAFLIDKFAVTSGEYKKYVDASGHSEPKGWFFTGYNEELKDHPVTHVNYKDAEVYCSSLEKRLPTEEEWEKAARGTDGRAYPWGDHFDRSRANTSLAGIMATVPVNSYESGKSPYGIFNMAGNVWEWTSTQGQDKEKRITKGGSWGLSHRYSRTFSRVEYESKAKTNNLGFRCAKDK